MLLGLAQIVFAEKVVLMFVRCFKKKTPRKYALELHTLKGRCIEIMCLDIMCQTIRCEVYLHCEAAALALFGGH